MSPLLRPWKRRVPHALAAVLLLAGSALAQTTVAVSGHALIPDGTAASSVKMRFELIGCSNGQARIDGVAILSTYTKEFPVDAITGAFSGNLYPNVDANPPTNHSIACNGTYGTTQFMVTPLLNGRPNGKSVPYTVGPGAFILESAAAAVTDPAIVTPTAVVTNPTGGGLQVIAGPLDVTALTCSGQNCTGGYNRIQNAAANLAQRVTVNFLNGITCSDDNVNQRTNCQPTYPITGTPDLGKIPIGQGNGTAAYADPQVQGLFAEGGTTAQNPVNIGGFDKAGPPAIHGINAVNGTPAGTEYGIVTRPIPSGTQATNETQLAGTAIDVNSGNKSAGTQRVVLATDQPNFTTALNVGGSSASGTASTDNPVKIGAMFGSNIKALQTDSVGQLNVNMGGQTAVTPTDGLSILNRLAEPQGPTAGVTMLPVMGYLFNGSTLDMPREGSTAGSVKVDGSAVTQPANIAQVAGTATDVNSGNKSAGTQRVVLATDQPALTNPLKTQQVDSGGTDATDTVNHAVKVNIVAGGGTGGGPADAASNAAASESDTARQKVTSVLRLLDTSQSAGSQLVPAKGDQTNGLFVNCKTGCAAAGDQSTGSTALGVANAVITLPLTGERAAVFQLQSGGTGVYTVTPQCSLDGGTLYNVAGYIQDPLTTALTKTATIASAQATTDYPVICPPGSSHAQMKVTSYTSGTANWLARATVNSGPNVAFGRATSAQPSLSNNDLAALNFNTSSALRVDASAAAVTVNQGSSNLTPDPWPVKISDGTFFGPTMDAASRAGFQKITDGTNTAAVKAASTAAAAADPSLVVQVSPNQAAFPVTIQANASVNETQLAGTAVDVNSGNKSAGTQRVVLATDQPNFTTALNVGGSSADGAASSDNPVKIGAMFGSNIKALHTDSVGQLNVNMGGVSSVTPTDGLSIISRLAEPQGPSAGVTMLPVMGYLFSGSVLDMPRSATIGNNVASIGISASASYGQFNTAAPTLANGNFGIAQLDSSGNLKVNIQAGGGTQYAEGTTQATATGTVALGKDPSNVVSPLQLDASKRLIVSCTNGCGASSSGQLGNALYVQTQANPALGAMKPGLAASNAALIAGLYSATPPVLIPGQQAAFQFDRYSRLIMAPPSALPPVKLTLDGNTTVGSPTSPLYTATVPATMPASYHATTGTAGIASAASATDIFTISGSSTAGVAILVNRIQVSCTQTTAGILALQVLKRSTADSGGTSTAVTETPDDSKFGASGASILKYTANPTLGTAVGDGVDSAQIGCLAAATASSNDVYLNILSKPTVLRGSAEQLTINLGGVTVTGSKFTITVDYMAVAGI